MAGFLYYFPNRTQGQVKVDQLRQWGLGYAFEERATPALVMRGPDGQRGIVVADPRVVEENDLGFWPERQRWEKVPPGLPGHEQGAWIGCSSTASMRPQDLLREQPLEGHWVRLADGQRWLVPIARKALPVDGQPMRYAIALPHVAGLDEAGNWTAGNVLAKYAQLWRTAELFWNALIGAQVDDEDGSATLEFGDTLDAATCALAANYRVGKLEVSLLGLLTHQHAVDVLYAVVDWPTVLEWVKKKETAGAGSCTEPGPADAIPSIAPPAPISGPSP